MNDIIVQRASSSDSAHIIIKQRAHHHQCDTLQRMHRCAGKLARTCIQVKIQASREHAETFARLCSFLKSSITAR